MIFIYDKNTFKIKRVIDSSNNDIDLFENEVIKEIKTNDLSQTDIRAYNEDGTVKSLDTQIKEKILVLKDNEVIKDGVVVELNPAYEDDYIELVKRNLIKLDNDKKIEYQKDTKKDIIVDKTLDDKLTDNLITVKEYVNSTNNEVIQQRQFEYSQKLDSKRAELIEMVLVRLSKAGSLIDTEKTILEDILKERQAIKDKHFKITEDDVLLLENKIDNIKKKDAKNGKRKTK